MVKASPYGSWKVTIMEMSTTFKVITLLFAAAFVAISITNAVYFNRLYRSIYNTVPALRNNLFGTNALSSSYAMWIVNLLLAILSGLLFLFAIFMLAGITSPSKDTDEFVTVSVPAARQVQGTTVTTSASAPVRPVTIATTPTPPTSAFGTTASTITVPAPQSAMPGFQR